MARQRRKTASSAYELLRRWKYEIGRHRRISYFHLRNSSYADEAVFLLCRAILPWSDIFLRRLRRAVPSCLFHVVRSRHVRVREYACRTEPDDKLAYPLQPPNL